jgi:cell division protease FtsH
MLDEAYLAATDLLSAHMADLKAGAKLLLERETITPDDFRPLQRVEVSVARPGKKTSGAVVEAVGHGE